MVSTTIYDCQAQLLGDNDSYTIIFNSVEKSALGVPVRTATLAFFKKGDILLILQDMQKDTGKKQQKEARELPEVLHVIAHYLAYGDGSFA